MWWKIVQRSFPRFRSLSTVSSSKTNMTIRMMILPEKGTLNLANPRLSMLYETASYLAGIVPKNLEFEFPTVTGRHPVEFPTERNVSYIIGPPPEGSKMIQDPLVHDKSVELPSNPSSSVPKFAQRMVRIRKRKMKVHKRRKRHRKFFARYRRVKMLRRKKKECAFRVVLMDKVNVAKKFDADQYVAEHLEELHKVWIPRTHKGKSLPEFLIKELIEKDRLEEERLAASKRDIISREPLVLPDETVNQFVKRMNEKHGWK
jgi:hypothetical protein